MIELRELNMVNGVNEKGEPFITITAVGNDKTMMIGQMSPKEWREHGMAAISCAEAAEQDSSVYKVMMDLLEDHDKAMQFAAHVITDLRKKREQ